VKLKNRQDPCKPTDKRASGKKGNQKWLRLLHIESKKLLLAVRYKSSKLDWIRSVRRVIDVLVEVGSKCHRPTYYYQRPQPEEGARELRSAHSSEMSKLESPPSPSFIPVNSHSSRKEQQKVPLSFVPIGSSNVIS
jgi:hypothetical protein